MKISQKVLNTHSTNNFLSRGRKIDDIMVTCFMTSSIPNDLADRETINQCSSPKHLRSNIHTMKNVRRCLFEENNNSKHSEENNNKENIQGDIENDDEDVENDDEEDIAHEEQIAASEKVNPKKLERKQIKDGLNYKDYFNIHKRYEKVSNKKIYLGEDITVGLLSWEITKSRRKPSLFFNDVLLYIWPENILKNRCLDEKRTTYKSSDGVVKVLTPRKLSLALSLYNDYLIDELHVSDERRIKYLCDSFNIIYSKIRDVRKKYK
ncbi:uncharacterized protein [Anoplolepis gracilipes]|uniref:uncharacterized protein n=1 Tax=Anoplolepis gracilipes TaxID=354296 RepID=UPI003BA0AB99